MMLRRIKSAKQEHKDRHGVLSEEHHRSQRNLLLFSLFCGLTLLLPDSSLIVSDKSIHLPGFNTPISLYHFISVASAILIALTIHVHALQSERLKAARTGSAAVDDVALFHLPGPLARFLAGLISYCIAPLTLGAMTYKALVDWVLGGGMVVVTVLVTLSLAALLHQRRLLATNPSVPRIKRWRWIAPYVGIACLLSWPLFTISSEETDAKIKEKIEKLAEPNGKAQENISHLVYAIWEISASYEIFLKKQMVRPLNLAYADLSGASLPDTYLKGADMRHANLQGARLPLADLSGADLLKANLKGAHLYRANLEGAELRWADLEGASLYKANLKKVDLRGTRLEGANLLRANLGADLEKVKLDGADLERAHLYEPNRDRAKLPCCAYLLVAREGDLESVSNGSPVYTNQRKVGYVLSVEYYNADPANGRRFTIMLRNKAPYGSAFSVALAKHDKVPEDGIALDEPLSPDGFVNEYYPFPLYRNRGDVEGPADHYKIHYSHSVHGLEVGAPVKLSGIEVGDVQWIDLARREDGKLQATITIRLMERLGRGGDAMESRDIVCGGLRARLEPISPIDPKLFVDLDPDAGTAEVEPPADCSARTPGLQVQDRAPSQGAPGPG